jgi:FAD/FMN-containing dehydrogenase
MRAHVPLVEAIARLRSPRARRRRVLGDDHAPATCFAMHAAKVARSVAQLRAHPRSRPASLRKQAPHDLRRHDDKLDISDLTDIITIDPVGRTCTAESGVQFRDLVAATLRHGFAPVIVPELASITIGGVRAPRHPGRVPRGDLAALPGRGRDAGVIVTIRYGNS